jgi:hypothetical protein
MLSFPSLFGAASTASAEATQQRSRLTMAAHHSERIAALR